MLNDIIKEINKINFTKLENIKFGDAFYLSVNDLEMNSVFKNILKIIRQLFIFGYKVDIKNKESLLFFFSSEYKSRKDYRRIFDVVKSTTRFVSEISSIKNKVSFDFYIILYIIQWVHQMRDTNLSLSQKTYIIPSMIESYKIIKLFKNISLDMIYGLVVLCDVHIIDCIIVQFFNLKNITTVSLQHGMYSSRYNEGLITMGKCKYFLCYGRFTKNEFLNKNQNNEKIIIVGMPQLIDNTVENILTMKNNKIIGIVFDGSFLKENDMKMLEVVHSYANSQNYDIIIKLHPGTNYDKYDFSKYHIVKVFYKEIDIYTFLEKAEFIVCSGSTVFLECLLLMKPVIIFQNNNWDIYYDILWCKFKNQIEMAQLLEKFINDKIYLLQMIINTREYLTCTTNVSENYESFFNHLMNSTLNSD